MTKNLASYENVIRVKHGDCDIATIRLRNKLFNVIALTGEILPFLQQDSGTTTLSDSGIDFYSTIHCFHIYD